MAWSTRELAELAGTTVNTVRHYHQLGLLPEPERRLNGYKQYEVSHLVCLLRIRRLVDLGVPLSQIGEISTGADGSAQVLRELDEELQATIGRLQQAREEIADILRDQAPADSPAGFSSVARRLSPADSSMIHLYSRLYDAEALADVRAMVEADPDHAGAAFDALPADADEQTRISLAEQLAPSITRSLIDFPWLSDPTSRLARSEKETAQTFIEAVQEFYNPAQVEVLARAGVIAAEQARATRESGEHRLDADAAGRDTVDEP
jgi:DNA-binding transcriptional MerR regulator